MSVWGNTVTIGGGASGGNLPFFCFPAKVINNTGKQIRVVRPSYTGGGWTRSTTAINGPYSLDVPYVVLDMLETIVSSGQTLNLDASYASPNNRRELLPLPVTRIFGTMNAIMLTGFTAIKAYLVGSAGGEYIKATIEAPSIMHVDSYWLTPYNNQIDCYLKNNSPNSGEPEDYVGKAALVKITLTTDTTSGYVTIN